MSVVVTDKASVLDVYLRAVQPHIAISVRTQVEGVSWLVAELGDRFVTFVVDDTDEVNIIYGTSDNLTEQEISWNADEVIKLIRQVVFFLEGTK